MGALDPLDAASQPRADPPADAGRSAADAAAPRHRDDPGAADRSPPGPSRAALAPAEALLEVIDRDGHVRQAWPVRSWPLRIGRAFDNDIVLTDPHLAAHHLHIEREAHGGLTLHSGPSMNGMTAAGRRLPGGASMPLPEAGGALELVAGRTRLRLRLAATGLAPELPLAGVATRPVRALPSALLGALLVAAVTGNAYLDSDADTLVRAAGNALLVAFTAAAVWCGAWALLSKTITRQSHFGWHLRVFVIAMLALLGAALLPGLLAFAFSWPALTEFGFVASYAIGATALYCHLLGLEPVRPRLVRAVVATGAIVGVALTLWFNLQRTSRLGDELYMTHLFPPALRLARPLPVDRFVEGMAPLQALLDRKAAEPPGDNATDPTPQEERR